MGALAHGRAWEDAVTSVTLLLAGIAFAPLAYMLHIRVQRGEFDFEDGDAIVLYWLVWLSDMFTPALLVRVL